MIPLFAVPKSIGDRIIEYAIICVIIGVLIIMFRNMEVIKKFVWGGKIRKVIIISVAITLAVTTILFTDYKFDEAKEPAFSKFAVMQRQKSKAHELCDLFPDEEVCKNFHKTIACGNDEECWDNMEDGYPIYPEDVIACFIHKDDVLDNDDILNIPHQCDSFHTISIRNLISDEPLIPIKKVKNIPPEIRKWADKVTPGHVAGIATGIKMILQNDEQLSELASEAIPSLDAIIALGGDNKQSVNQSAGIMIGLYNAGISMADSHVEIARNTNRKYCKSYTTQDVVPIRCFTPHLE